MLGVDGEVVWGPSPGGFYIQRSGEEEVPERDREDEQGQEWGLGGWGENQESPGEK